MFIGIKPPESPVNELFEVAPCTADGLWMNAVPMPPEAKRSPEAFSRIRRSADGAWVIRKTNPDNSSDFASLSFSGYRGITAHELADKGLAMLKLMHTSKLDVISTAVTVSLTAERAFVITPWVDKLRETTEDEYLSMVWPRIRACRHAATAAGIGFTTTEIYGQEQHSVAEEVMVRPFLQDVDFRTLL